MNNLILCEGKTDAILLGYYLIRTFGWEATRNTPRDKDSFKRLKQNQYAH